MLIGEYQHSLDPKGRVIMPSKFREDLGETFIVTKGLDKCLFAYSMSEWAILDAKVKSLPLSDPTARTFVRFMFSGACECVADKQGRILLPANLREHANLTSEVSIIGVSTRVEIWDSTKWNDYCSGDDMSGDSLAEKMAMLGI